MRKVTLLFAALLSLTWGTMKADELTVYDGAGTSQYIPVYGNYADTNGSISECVMPASALSTMTGSEISSMTFYLQSKASAAWTATFKVYMKEVEDNFYDSSTAFGDDDATTVYTGTLDGTGSTMVVNFDNNYTYNGGNLVIGFKVTSSGNYKSAYFYGETQSTNTGFYNKTSKTRVKFLPKTTFTYSAGVVEGSALVIKEGSAKLTSPYAYSFGLTTAGTTKTFTLSNPGAEATPISVSATGGFGASFSDNATSIPAGGEVTLTITMPEATANGTVTVSSTADGIDDFVFNVSGTIRDASKMWVNFAEGLPEGWTNSGNWTISTTGADGDTSGAGYAYNTTSYGSNKLMYSPLLTFAEGEKLYLMIKGHGATASWNKLTIRYSADGTNWTNAKVLESITNTWQSLEVSEIPAGNWYIGFYGSYVYFTDIYGGTESTAPVIALSQTSYDFGLIAENTTSEAVTITNTGKSALTGLNIISSNPNFTVNYEATEIAANGGTATFTVTMAPNATGAQSATITIKSDNADDLTFTATGAVAKEGTATAVFNDATLAGWTKAGNTSFNSDETAAYFYYSTNTLTSPKVSIASDDFLAINAKMASGYGYVTVQGSADGTSWTDIKKLDSSVLNQTDYTTAIVSGISTDYKYLRLNGYYCYVKQVAGLNYAPVLTVTQGTGAVTSPAAYAFGEVGANQTVTYNFTNTGAGTINITNVASDNEVFTTNWTEAVVADNYDLIITVNYDAAKAGEQNGTVTVTTTEGEFVINLTSTFLAANAPKFALFIGEAEQTTGADLGFGIITEATTKEFIIKNDGTGALNVTGIALPDAAYTTDLEAAPSTESPLVIAAGTSKTINVTLAATAKAIKTGNIVISADGFEDFSFVANAYVLAGTETVDCGNLPGTWDNGGWTLDATNNDLYASSYSSKPYLTSPKLSCEANDFIIVTAKKYDNDNGDYIQVQYSTDNGTTWTNLQKLDDSTLPTRDAGYSNIVVSDIPEGTNKLRFQGYYARIKTIAGITYDANDPKMGIYTNADCSVAATTSVTKDFGFVTEDATQTYYIKNDGTGTLTLDQDEVPAGFSAVLGESELAAGESTTLTITFGQISGGYRGGNIVVNGSDGSTFTVAVSGVMVDEDKLNLDFATADIPSTWTAGSWAKKDGGYVEAGYTSTTMETNVLTAVAGETLVVVAKNTSTYSSYTFGVKYKKADAEEWSDLIAAANLGTAWKTLTATIEEAGDYQLQFTGNYAQIKHIYGLTEPTEPVMVVYDGEAKAAATYNFGNVANDADATHTFTVKNEGKAVLAGLTAALSGDQASHYDVTISGLTDGGVAANGEATITVTQKKDNLGSHAATLTISSTSEGIADFVIELSGVTRDASTLFVDFADGNMPEGWTAGTSWTVTSGYAQQTSYSTASALVTTPLTVAEGETLSFEAARYNSYSAAQLKVRYTTDGGITWSEYVDYAAQITSGSFVTLTLTDVPAGTAIVEFYGRYVKLDNISGFVPTTAPVFALTEGTTAVANGSTKEFGNLTEAGVATYTLTNNGTADMVTTVATTGVATAAIFGEGEGITIADNTVTLAAGKSATITLTLPYEAPFGEKTGAMTLTSEGWVGDFTVNYTATTIDPTALFVDFSSNAKPAGWYNSGFSFTSGAATINSSTEATFITEKLTVSGTDDVLSYDAVVSSSWASSYASLVVSYSTDRRNWTEIATLGENDLTTTFQTFTVSGLEAGEYYLQFKGKYVTVDNIIGWHKVTGIEHDLFFVSIDVPEGEYVPGSEYTATVKVVNLRAASETVAAELFVKNEKATELTEQVIALDETKTFTLTATVPEEGKHLAYVKVYNNDVTIETEPVTFVSAHNRSLEITDFARTSNETVDADANNEFTSTFNVTVKNNGTLDQEAENVSVSITDADGNVIGENATAWTLANSQTVFINPGAYTTDGAVLAIWRWNTDVDGEWALLTKINDELYSVERNGKTNFCIVRLKKEGDEGYSSENGGLNWTNCYNQSTNMTNTDGNFFSFKSWGDVDGEDHQWFNFGTMANLPVGASTTMSVSLTTSALEGGVLTFKAKENVSNTVSTASATVTVNAAAPKFELALGSTAIEDGDAVAYGTVKAATTKTFTISNTGTKMMEAPSISVPEGFEYETVAANGAEVDWRLFFYKENTDLSADQGSFKATATENKFIIENVNVPYEGVVFSVHNDAWTNKYGWSDEGGTLDATGKTVKLAAHGDDANGWMTIPAGNYDFVWNANDLTLLAKPAGSILAGETADVNVTLKAEQGKVSGNLVFTYKVDATTNGTFNVALSGRSIFADTWAVDFEDGQIPADWDNSNNWTVGESEGNHYATLTGWVAKSIMTPRLAAEANEELTFDVLSVGSSFTYAYSTDKTNWSDEVSVSATGEQTFVAPAEGNYYLRFTTRNGRLDNLVGFRANPLEHDTEIAASSVPVTGKQYNVYTATVTLKESVGKAEEVTACLYVGGEVKTTETQTITANGSTTVTLTWEPQEVISEAVEAYVAVTGTGIDLATEVVSLTIAEVYTLDEATSASTVDAVSNETVLLKRKFAAGWNTVCLPFAINDVEAFFGEGAKAYDFTAYNTTNGELSFSTVSTLSASYPYVVYVPVAITEPMKLQNITISSYNDYGYYRTFNGVKFQGTYAPIAAGEWGATGVVYGLTSEGRIAKAGANASMKGFRAYFDIPSGSSVKALRFEDIEDAISLIQTDAEENEAIYNVAGQRVQKMQKGINIINGKKILK